jgi:hypothetical protein
MVANGTERSAGTKNVAGGGFSSRVVNGTTERGRVGAGVPVDITVSSSDIQFAGLELGLTRNNYELFPSQIVVLSSEYGKERSRPIKGQH